MARFYHQFSREMRDRHPVSIMKGLDDAERKKIVQGQITRTHTTTGTFYNNYVAYSGTPKMNSNDALCNHAVFNYVTVKLPHPQ